MPRVHPPSPGSSQRATSGRTGRADAHAPERAARAARHQAAADQASASTALELGLPAGEPGLPDDLRPMLPRRALRLPDDGRHLFDPSWGGLRVLAYVGPAGVRLIAARGRDLTGRVPEVSAGLSEALAGQGPCIVDGELVAPDAAGRLDRGALAARLGRSRASGRRAVRMGPASLIAWDVLVAGGRSLLARPLSDRRERLLRLLRPAAHVVPLTPVAGGGAELLAAAETMGLAAVIAKHAAGPYLPGVRSRLWLRVDLPASDQVVAGPQVPASRPDLVALLRLPWD